MTDLLSQVPAGEDIPAAGGPVRVSLAGRIAVQVGGSEQDERGLPGRQPRLAFSMLVIERDRAVSRDELAENLWLDGRPDTWDTALRGVVSRIRRFLATVGLDGSDLLRAEHGGYRLCLPAGTEVDVERAAAQSRLARVRLAAGDSAAAAQLAAVACSVLARPLLGQAHGPWAERTRRELGQLLLGTLDLLAEARLVRGEDGHAAAAAENAIELDPFRETAHRLLIRALAAAGNHGAALRAYDRCRRLLAEELGVDPSPETRAVHLAILQAEPPGASAAALLEPRGTEPHADVSCPYPGLQTFDEDDAEWFFGRGADVSRLLDRLAGTRFLTVLGPSGSGKSSLVRAGLLPALRHGALAGSDTWTLRVLRPGAEPVRSLAGRLAELHPTLARAATREALLSDGLAPHHALEAAVDAGLAAERVVIVVDQLEEVFTLTSDAGERRAFLGALAAAASIPSGRTVVITTLRADFYPQLADHPQFADLASAHQFLVTPMDEVGLAEAVEGPARRAGLALEPGLTETILRDVARRPGSLPLLGHALYELWERRSDGMLTLEAYRQAGGVEGSLAERAEAIHDTMSTTEQAVVRRLLLRLTLPGEAAVDTRRQVPFAELPTCPDEQQTVEDVVATLTAARLLTASGRPDGERCVEVSHEALMRAWPRLRRWIDADRSGLVVHRRLTEAAVEWERLGKDDDALYRGARLAEAVAWAERDAEAANEQERAFLQASMGQEQAERRQRVRRLRATVTALSVGLLAVAALSVVASVQAQQASKEARIATSRGLAAAAVAELDLDPERSILLALQAVETTRADGSLLPEAQEALHRAVKRSRLVFTLPQGHHSLGVSPDGRRIATTTDQGSASLWDADSREQVLTLDGNGGLLHDLTFSADGNLLATASEDGTTRVWDASSGALLQTLEGLDAARFSPDGAVLATASEDGVRLFDVGTWTETGRLADDASSLAFSPDSSLLVAGNIDGHTRVWDLHTGKRTMTLSGHAWGISAVAISPDGQHVATASFDGTARTWDLRTGQHLETFFADGMLFDVAYSPAGSRLAIASADGSAAVWDPDSGRHLMTLAGHAAIVGAVAFTPHGEHLVTSSNDGTTRVWDVSVGGSRDWLTVPTAEQRFVEVAFSSDGRWFAAPADGSHGVTVWDAQTGAEVITLSGQEGEAIDVAFSPEGTRLAAATFDQTIPVWDLATGELELELAGHPGAWPRMVTFSPDGRRLLSGADDGTARVWDLATGEAIAVLDRGGGAVGAVAYSPEGRYLATGDDTATTVWDAGTFEERHTFPSVYVNGVAFGPEGVLVSASDDGTATIWSIPSGTAIATMTGHTGSVEHVSITSDGSRVATAGHEGTAKVWDATNGRRLFTLFSHDGPVWSTAFSPDGRLLATASSDGTVALHLLPIDELVDVARDRVTRHLTNDECRQYLQLARCP